MRSILYILLIIVIGGCAKQRTTSSAKAMESYRALAFESLEVKPITFVENSKGDYVLGTYSESVKDIPGTSILHYVVINKAEEKVELKGILPNGIVNWLSDYTLEIYSPPGMPKNGSETKEDYTKIYSIKTGKMTNMKGASD